jgi:hypothetical protein
MRVVFISVLRKGVVGKPPLGTEAWAIPRLVEGAGGLGDIKALLYFDVKHCFIIFHKKTAWRRMGVAKAA